MKAVFSLEKQALWANALQSKPAYWEKDSMRLMTIILSAWMVTFQLQAHANAYIDKKIFEHDARQGVLKEQSSREEIQFRGLVVTEFSDSLNLCGELGMAGSPEWVRFIKTFDKETEHFNAVWIEPGDAISEVEEFKKAQFDTYWDRRCSTLYSIR